MSRLLKLWRESTEKNHSERLYVSYGSFEYALLGKSSYNEKLFAFLGSLNLNGEGIMADI